LAFDRNPESRHFGRLYLVDTGAPASKYPNTTIKLRFSDPPYQTWSTPIPVSDNTPNSKFLPRIASAPLSGNVAVCWHDFPVSSIENSNKGSRPAMGSSTHCRR
jgi:hypothetical protein